jgi:hypothetical protein
MFGGDGFVYGVVMRISWLSNFEEPAGVILQFWWLEGEKNLGPKMWHVEKSRKGRHTLPVIDTTNRVLLNPF